MNLNRNLFTNSPTEFSIPRNSKIVFVSDFFVSEVGGGAELTTEAIIDKSTHTVFKLHSASLTEELVEVNKTKYWVLTNFTQAPTEGLLALANSNIRYSIVEYDFKFCRFRSAYRHLIETGTCCDCASTFHGKFISTLFSKAENVFWMSELQKLEYFKYYNDFKQNTNNIVLSSVFSDKILNMMKQLLVINKTKDNLWSFLGGGSWIKGCPQTEAWTKIKRMKTKKLMPMPYEAFLFELSQHKGFVFKPLDFDTCPRSVIEAKLLGCELNLNGNVLHQDEDWFKGSMKDTEEYLRGNINKFWDRIII